MKFHPRRSILFRAPQTLPPSLLALSILEKMVRRMWRIWCLRSGRLWEFLLRIECISCLRVYVVDGESTLSMNCSPQEGAAQMICSVLAKIGYIAFRPLIFLSSLPLALYGYSLGLTMGFWTVGSFTGLWIPSPIGMLIQIVFTAPFLVAGVGGAILTLFAQD